MFEQVDAAEAWGSTSLAGRDDGDPARSVLSARSWWRAGRRPDPAPRSGHGGPAPSLEPSGARRGEVTTLDHLSRAVRFGIGRSGSPRLRRAWASVRGEPGALLRALEFILEPGGQPSATRPFYRFTDVTVVPRPYPAADPPVRVAATSRDFPRIARMGLPIFVSGCAAVDIPELAACSRDVPRGVAGRGARWRRDACLRIRSTPPPRSRPPGRTARRPSPTTPAPGRPDPGAGRSSRDGAGRAAPEPGRATGQPLVRRDPEHEGRLRHRPGAGRPSGPAPRRAPGDGVAAELNPGGLLSTARELRSLEILTKQVMPAFK